MTLDQVKNGNRFEVMKMLKGWNDIPDDEIDTVIRILREREIGIPNNIYIQKNLHLAKIYGYGIRGFFIGTQQLKYCVSLWLPLLFIIPPFCVILFGLFVNNPYNLWLACGFYATAVYFSTYSFYKCWHNTSSTFLKVLVIIICILSVLNLLRFTVAAYLMS